MKKLLTLLLILIAGVAIGQNVYKYPTFWYNDITVTDSTWGNFSRSPILSLKNNFGRYFQDFKWSLQQHALTFDSAATFTVITNDTTFYTQTAAQIRVVANGGTVALGGLYAGIGCTDIDSSLLLYSHGVSTKWPINGGTSGQTLTTDGAGQSYWGNGALPAVLDTLILLTGDTINLTNNATNVIVASGSITDVVLRFPTGTNGNALIVSFTQNCASTTIIGTNTGTITATKTTILQSSNNVIPMLFNNTGGNWH